MKRHLLLTFAMVLATVATAQKYVGGDLSLVPAYEAAGDQWLDADGNVINTHYSDGMITYVHDVAGWNSIRVRLLADPTQDDKVATCQDLDYVKRLGKRIKDSGMSFLLDIFYSDTWTDVSQQWIPAGWGFDRSTDTGTLAAKVKSYTTEVLNELVAYGAKPDFIQIGNEVSYGMLWDSAAGKNKGTHFFSTNGAYSSYTKQIARFATLLKAAAEGVRASNCPTAKIVLHCERTASSGQCKNFFTWVELAGFTDYDIIGLSYYPLWHKTLNELKATISTLQSAFPSKEIQIVETGYHHTAITVKSDEYDTSATWPYSPAGQASFVKDLIAALGQYESVTGLYYWQPEECGNGASAEGTNRVMDAWDQRGFWDITWKSGTHVLRSAAALTALKSFLDNTDIEEPDVKDFTGAFTNMDFESCEVSAGSITSCPGWTLNEAQGWGTLWPVVTNEWHSSLVSGNCFQSWVAGGRTLAAGDIISQSTDNLPAGTYTVTAIVHTDYNGIYLFANGDTQLVNATTTWGTAYETTVTTTLTEAGPLTIGLKLTDAASPGSEINLYADNFKCVSPSTGIHEARMDNRANDAWYTLDGRRLNSKPARKGLYIHSGRKVVVR